MNKVCVIGASCIDVIIDKQNSTSINNKEYVNNINIKTGGDALNEAIVLSKHNVDCELITIIGNDLSGKLLLDEVNKNCIYLNPNCVRDDIETSTAIILKNNNETNYISTLNGSIRKLSIDNIVECRKQTKYICFASLFISNELNNNLLAKLFSDYKKQGKILIADTSMPKHNETCFDYKDSLSCLDYFIPNIDEAKKLCNKNDLKECAKILFDTGIKNVIIKCGKDGVYLKNDKYDELIKSEYINNNVADPTGSGDSFVAGFVSKIINNEDIINSIKYGMLCGYKASKYIGATTWLDYE